MALIEDGNKEKIINNIDSILNTALNVEGAGERGVIRLRTMATEIASLIKLREFVADYNPATSTTTPKKGGK